MACLVMSNRAFQASQHLDVENSHVNMSTAALHACAHAMCALLPAVFHSPHVRERERERDVYVYVHIHMYTHVHK